MKPDKINKTGLSTMQHICIRVHDIKTNIYIQIVFHLNKLDIMLVGLCESVFFWRTFNSFGFHTVHT